MKVAISPVRTTATALALLIGFAWFHPQAMADLDATTPQAVIQLIAKYGADFTNTLEGLPELKAYLETSPSPERAFNAYLAQTPNQDQAKKIARLAETLDLRAILRSESANVPNGVYAVAAQIPPLANVANDALKEAGMSLIAKDPNEVTSNMSTAQASHLLTRLALQLVDAQDGEKERLLAKFKEAAAKLRS